MVIFMPKNINLSIPLGKVTAFIGPQAVENLRYLELSIECIVFIKTKRLKVR